MKKYKLGSLFDGSGGFPLAGSLCGITPMWASEVEPYPIAVTKSRFPHMKHLGDISKVNGAEIEPVDIITFGSPCQDLSVAGKRAGLKHEANGDEETTRSGLFMEAVRIIKEMRRATNGNYPTFALWENVPGAFSSNKGEDFRIVCEELIKIVEPSASMPPVPKNGWSYADSYCGDGWSLAYRVFDAQYWGVPQRRRRIHLVLHLTGRRARAILFEREGVRGYFEAGRTPWKGTATDAQDRAGTTDREGEGRGRLDEVAAFRYLARADAGGIGYQEKVAPTLMAGPVPACVQAVPVGFDTYNMIPTGDRTVTLRAGSEHNYAPVFVPVAFDAYNQSVTGNVTKSLTGAATDSDHVPVVFDARGNGDGKTANTLTGDHNNRITDYSSVVVDHQKPVYPKDIQYIVRRLTPIECARLQGFADLWGVPDQKDDLTDEEYRFWLDVRNTHAAINGKAVKEYTKEQMLKWYNKLHTDSAEYKMWGNGIALPPALYCMQGIVAALNEVKV